MTSTRTRQSRRRCHGAGRHAEQRLRHCTATTFAPRTTAPRPHRRTRSPSPARPVRRRQGPPTMPSAAVPMMAPVLRPPSSRTPASACTAAVPCITSLRARRSLARRRLPTRSALSPFKPVCSAAPAKLPLPQQALPRLRNPTSRNVKSVGVSSWGPRGAPDSSRAVLPGTVASN